jgi:hypothetical protein
LWFDEKYFNENVEAVELLKRGDRIKFRGFVDKLRVDDPSRSENMFPHA